ncbi:MAG: hypothetical protein WED10_01910 [Brumimicrobium sp.]
MNEKWVHQNEIDREKWDQLVETTPAPSIFSLSFYLDATADDWCAFTNDDFTFAIPVAFTKKIGVLNVYPPFFHRAVSAIGDTDKIDWQLFEKELTSKFKRGTFHLDSSRLKNIATEQLTFQTINKKIFKLRRSTVKKIKKFEQSQYELKFTDDSKKLSQLIISILSKKLDFYNTKESENIFKLVKKAESKNHIICLGIYDDTKLIGGLIALEYNKTTLYLKGACKEYGMASGAMYAAINKLIQSSIEKNYSFDFGGSSVEGVRYFNTRFSAIDNYYYRYSWENGPFWFKLIQFFRKWIKK